MSKNKIEQFLSEKFGEVRAIKIDGVLYFVALDVSKALNYANVNKVTDKIDNEDILRIPKSQLTNLGSWEQTGGRDVLLMNEGGLYQTIASITKKDMERYDSSREFKRWITNEVIPTIRETGAYVEEEREEEVIDKYFSGFSDDLKLAMFKELKKNNEELKVKAGNWDKFLDTNSTYTFTDVAKMISTKANEDVENSIQISNQALTKYLREKGILSKNKSGKSYTNKPNQDYEKYFDVVSVKATDEINKTQTRVKSNGIEFIYSILIEDGFNTKIKDNT